jgi:prepilin-type N-terminal cleavage/methylation domain-containing protein
MRSDRPAPSSAAERGFSLIELLVAMLIAVEILVAGAIAFDLNNRMAQVQTQITDVQQSLRIAQTDMARLVRMAGRGGLPSELAPGAVFNPADPVPSLNGLAIEIRSNVTNANHDISRGLLTPSPAAVDGTDILTIRGCLSTPLYQLNPLEFDWDPDGDDTANQASLVINKLSVAGVRQPLKPLLDEINAYPVGEPIKGKLILVSPESRSVYGIAEIVGVPAVGGLASDPDSLTFTLQLKLDTNSPLNPIDAGVGARRFPTKMTASYGCFLEEYRYYVYETAGDTLTPQFPRLARARFEPGTEEPYQGDTSNFRLDLADGVFDLQVALGIDTDYKQGNAVGSPGSFGDDSDNVGIDDVIYEAASGDAERAQDDWLFNAAADATTDWQYVTHDAAGTQAGVPAQVYFVRLTTWARTRRADPKYAAPVWTAIEDEAMNATYWTGDALQFRKRALTTIIDMRNI